MLIKRVVIQGFKTFATKTEFVFDPGVTAIVGPNGSGKSNIVDAIRWCLGEQSFTLLRSKKTSDVIFSGSDLKARLGMAQVTLTLDNSGGEIPIDFTEVEIARRAYRDGNNEYLINGQRVRLMDVNEMLAQTGLGRRTYALIGQGLIDKVLSLAPEDRRSLFEEAAGITGYQTKRSATLRRLDATQQNLTRALDIVAELSPRLKYLRRQAERAREREQIAADLRGLLRIWYGYHWHATLGQLTLHKAAEQRLQAGVQQRQRALARVETKIESLRATQAELRSRLADLHRESSQLHLQAEAVGRELAVVQERARQNQDRLEEIQRELVPLRLQRETLETRLAELESGVDAAAAEHQQRQQEVDALQIKVSQQESVRERLLSALDESRRALDAARNRQTELRSQLQQLADRRPLLLAQQTSEQDAREQAAREAQTTSLDVEKADEVVLGGRAQITLLQADSSEVEESIQTLRRELTTADQQRQEAERAADRLQTRHDLLQRLRDEGAGYASGVRSVLQAARSDSNLSGIVGTVASLVKVPAELDKAIDTALGGAYQNVVARTWADARRAIEYLDEHRAGRATFLPLDRLNVLPSIPAPGGAGILGNAADLVDCDAEVADAVKLLLGRVWVASDLSAARQALDGIRQGPRPTVVTVAGEVVRPGGAVTGGSFGNRRDESVLTRERDLRELPERIRQADDAVQRAVAICTDLVGRIESAQMRAHEMRSAIDAQTRQTQEDQRTLEDLRRRLDRAQQAAQWQADRLAKTAAELASLDTMEQGLVAQLDAADTAYNEAEHALRQAEADSESAGLGDLLQQLADSRTVAASAEGHLRSQRALLDNLQRNLAEAVDQISRKEARSVELVDDSERLREHLQTLGQREESLRRSLHDYQLRIDPAETELAGLEGQQTAEEANERVYQQNLRSDETAWNTAQLQLKRTEDRLAQIRHEIEQDLGLVLLEESEELAYQPPLPWDAIVDQLPVAEELPDTLETEVREMRARLGRVSNVNPDAPREYEEASSRYDFLLTQSEDLEAAAADLRKIVRELDEVMRTELERTFAAVSEQFVYFFMLLFNGGSAKLVLTDPDDLTNTGIEIVARPPGKRPQSLALLSGGERALSACALIFAILRVSPTPFCVLDEVDAALDEANVDRFRRTVDELSDGTQFIIVTHNRRTLEGAHTIYGVTMSNDGVSKVISLRLEEDKLVQENGDGARAAAEDYEELVKL